MQKEKSVAICTLGCRLNQYETDSLRANFLGSGYKLVSFKEAADAYIVNSCTVTLKSDAKTRNYVNRVRRANPSAKLFLTGCYAQTDKEALEELYKTDRDLYIIPNSKKYDLYNIVETSLKGGVEGGVEGGREGMERYLEGVEDDYFEYYLGEDTLRTRNYLKIQDGCNEGCSYCKIPMARGEARSRSISKVYEAFGKMLSYGFKEIILTGINIGDYRDGDYGLKELLRGLINNYAGEYRVHLSSIEPNKVDEGLMGLLTSNKMCKHMHLPLQSASNKVLEAMGRNYRVEDYYNTVKRLREIDEAINITTDVMVGFPVEGETEFEKTYNFLKEVRPSYIHTFKYSEREGTKSKELGDMVDERVKTKRSERIRELSDVFNKEYRKRFEGRELEVLPEQEEGDYYKGQTEYYIPVRYPKNASVEGEEKGFKVVLIKNTGAMYSEGVEVK